MRAPRIPLTSLLAAALGAALLAGCGGGATKGEEQPAACREGVQTYLEALAAAPGEVVLAGETPISGCFTIDPEEGELADLGEATVAAATKLNAEARAEPGGEANVELGYLLGAMTRGEAETEGVHAELLRRLAVAARFVPEGEQLSPRFTEAYEKGFAAGREHG